MDLGWSSNTQYTVTHNPVRLNSPLDLTVAEASGRKVMNACCGFPNFFSGANKIRKRIFEPEGRGTFPAHDRAYLSPPFFPGSFAMFVYAGKGDHFHPLWLGKMPNFRLTLCVKKYCPLLFCIGKSNLIQGRKYLTYPTTFRLYSSQNCANPNSFPWIFLKKDLSALFMPNQYLGEGSYSTLLYVHVHFFESEGWSEEEGEVCSCL